MHLQNGELGINDIRFTKTLYPGSHMQVRFTCKEKAAQKQREPTDIPRGIVKWYIEILDDEGEIAGVATIRTMVKKKEG